MVQGLQAEYLCFISDNKEKRGILSSSFIGRYNDQTSNLISLEIIGILIKSAGSFKTIEFGNNSENPDTSNPKMYSFLLLSDTHKDDRGMDR